jgi:hypothetical protein
VVTRYEISLDTLNVAAMGNDAAVGAEEAKVLKSSVSLNLLSDSSTHTLTVMIEQMMVMNHLYLRDQF